MAKIYRRTDRISVKIDDVTVRIRPLSLAEKSEIQTALANARKSGSIKEASRGVALAIKYAVKGIDGLEDSDDKAYRLEFDDDILSDACVDDLLNIEITNKLALVCSALINGVPKEFRDTQGNILDGVEFIKTDGEEKNV